MKYFVPSKTFLVGEYSALVGGAALGLATSPCFEISYLKQQTPNAFHPESPAGRYLAAKKKSIGVHFHDPHRISGIQGGFGRSTAEYLAVAIPDILQSKPSPQQIRDEYLKFFEHEKVKPSGIDLLIQYLGGISLIHPQENEFQTTPWRFAELDFFVVATGLKINTHEHLEQLDLKRIEDLPMHSSQVIDAYLNKTSEKFLNTLQSWSNTLNQRKLTHLSAVEIKSNLEKNKHVRLVKPCGALGADVVLVFFDPQNKDEVQAELRQQKLKIQASREDITEGFVQYVG